MIPTSWSWRPSPALDLIHRLLRRNLPSRVERAGGHVFGTRVEMGPGSPRFWMSCVFVGAKWFEKERMWLDVVDVWAMVIGLKEWHAFKALYSLLKG